MATKKFCPFMSTAKEKVDCDKTACGAVQTVFDPNMHIGVTSCHPAGAIVDSAMIIANRIESLIEKYARPEAAKA
jgi:hypothetical protein